MAFSIDQVTTSFIVPSDAVAVNGMPVVVNDPLDGEVLTFESGTWVNEPGGGGGSGNATSIQSIPVTFSSPAATGDVIAFSSPTHLVNETPSNLTETASSVLQITGGTGATLKPVTIEVHQAHTNQAGYLSATDWNTFNGKANVASGAVANDILFTNGQGQPVDLGIAIGDDGTSTKVPNSSQMRLYVGGQLGQKANVVAAPIANDILFTNSQGQPIDSQLAIGDDGTTSTVPNSSLVHSYVNTQIANIPSSTVTGKLLSGYTPSSGTLAATDSILDGFDKMGGSLATSAGQMVLGKASNIATPTTLSGDVTVNSTGVVSVANTTAKLLTGYTPSSGTLAATDSILGAFDKVGASLATTAGQLVLGNASSIATPTSVSGDISLASDGTATIASSAVTNAKLANAGANTWKGNNTGASTVVADNASGALTESTSSVLTITGGTNALLNSASIQVKQADASQAGYLSSADWTTFNNKANLVTTPTANDFLLTNASGQPIDGGMAVGNDGTNATIPTSNSMQTYVIQALLNAPSLPLVHFASTANIASLSGLGAIDGYTPTAGQFLLVKNQTSGDNGVWIVASGAWTRAKVSAGAWVAVTTETTYSQLGIQGGIVNVLNGTAAKNLQFQFNVQNPAATFGSTTVYVTATTKLPVRDLNNGYVCNNTGNNTNNNGTASFPYLTVTQDLAGASFPHITNVGASGAAYPETLSITSGQSNLTVQSVDCVTAGKVSFSAPLTLASGNTRYREKGITRSTGASTPIVLAAGNLGRHTFQDCVWTTSGTSLMSLDASCTNWINLYNIDPSGSPLASIPLPNFSTAFTFNIYNQTQLLAFSFVSGATGANCTINVVNCPKGSVMVPSGFTGTLTNFDGYQVNAILTSQGALNAILANTTLSGFYAVSFATPTGMEAGCIFEKLSSGGFTANNIVERFATGTTSAIYDLTTQLVYLKNATGGFNGWVAPASGGGGITALTGDVTATGPGSATATIASSVVTNTKMANAGANTWKGNNTGSSAAVADNASGALTESTSTVLTITGGSNALLNAATIRVKQATGLQDGYLASADWTAFNSKQTALTNPVTASTSSPTANTVAIFNGTGTQVTATTTLPAATMPALSGDVGMTAGTTTTTISNSAVSNAKMANANANTWKGNNTGSATAVADNASGALTEATSSVLTITSGANALLNAASIQVKQASSSQGGYLSSADWSTFNGKQAALTNPVTASTSNPSANTLAVFNGTGDQVAATTTLPAAAMPALTGDVTNTAGSLSTTIGASTVTGKLLTGYSAGAGSVAASDSILQAFQKLGGSLAAASGKIIVGNASNVAAPVNMTGDVSITNAGVTTVGSTTPAASTVAKWDANILANAAGFVPLTTTTITSGGTLTLTVASNRLQIFTGSTTHTVQLPNATTLALDTTFVVNNQSTGVVSVNDGSASSLIALTSGATIFFILTKNTTTAGTWTIADWTKVFATDGSPNFYYVVKSYTTSATLGLNERVTEWTISSGQTCTLPNGASVGGKEFIVINMAASTANLTVSGPASAATLLPGQNGRFISDGGSTWQQVAPQAASLPALTSANLWVGNGSNVATAVAISGDVSMTNTGATTLANSAVIGKTLSTYAAAAGTLSTSDTIVGGFNKVGASLATTSGQIIVGNGSNVATPVAMSGDVGIVAGGAATIAANAVTNAKMATMAASTLKGNATGSAAVPTDLSVSAVTTLLATTAPTASRIAEWDTNANMSGNNFLASVTNSTATTNTLAVGSNAIQIYSGTGNTTYTLPNATTLPIGWSVTIINTSNYIVLVNNFTPAAVGTIPYGSTLPCTFTCTNVGGSAGTWSIAGLPLSYARILVNNSSVTASGVAMTLNGLANAKPPFLMNSRQNITIANSNTVTFFTLGPGVWRCSAKFVAGNGSSGYFKTRFSNSSGTILDANGATGFCQNTGNVTTWGGELETNALLNFSTSGNVYLWCGEQNGTVYMDSVCVPFVEISQLA